MRRIEEISDVPSRQIDAYRVREGERVIVVIRVENGVTARDALGMARRIAAGEGRTDAR